MKVTSAPSVSACFEHIITMHKPEQATPHIIAKPIHVLLPPYAVNEKHQKHNMNQLLIYHQANMTCLIIATTLLLLLNVPSTYANQNETSSYNEDILINKNLKQSRLCFQLKKSYTFKMIFIPSVTLSTYIRSFDELAPTNLASFLVDKSSRLSISLLYHKSGLISISFNKSNLFSRT